MIVNVAVFLSLDKTQVGSVDLGSSSFMLHHRNQVNPKTSYERSLSRKAWSRDCSFREMKARMSRFLIHIRTTFPVFV